MLVSLALVAAQAHSPMQDRAVVVGALNFTRAFGGAAGLVIAWAIYSNSQVVVYRVEYLQRLRKI